MKSSFTKVALAFGVVAACMFGLAACANNGGSGGVAATVNGTEIKEQKVTDQIENIRKQSGLDDKDQWGQFLVQNDMTPSSVRDQIIDTFVEQELIKQGASELGISVEDSELDEYVDKMKANYDDDEKWKSALEQAGFTEDDYREMIKESLLEQKVGDHFEDDANLTDEDYVTSANTYASSYDGAKRSSHILFKVDDTSDEAAMSEAKAQAEQVLAQINAGADFAELAKQYSGDTGSAENGGDVGWDQLNSFVTEYTDALDGLELNQVSGLVESDYGIHIIKCTEVFTAPEEVTSLDQIPEAFQDNIKEMAASVKANTAYEEWLQGLKDNADIQKNDMPSGLPYDIDLTPYQDAAKSDSESSESAEGESDETVTEEVADEVAAEEAAEGITVESEDGAEVEVESVEVTEEGSESSESSSSSTAN